jgi:transcriptional regulator with XRE-family HTH domain
MSLRDKFGKRIKKLRKSREFTQEQLAERISMSTSFISSVERGIDAPSFETLDRLAEALGVNIYELFLFDSNRDE